MMRVSRTMRRIKKSISLEPHNETKTHQPLLSTDATLTTIQPKANSCNDCHLQHEQNGRCEKIKLDKISKTVSSSNVDAEVESMRCLFKRASSSSLNSLLEYLEDIDYETTESASKTTSVAPSHSKISPHLKTSSSLQILKDVIGDDAAKYYEALTHNSNTIFVPDEDTLKIMSIEELQGLLENLKNVCNRQSKVIKDFREFTSANNEEYNKKWKDAMNEGKLEFKNIRHQVTQAQEELKYINRVYKFNTGDKGSRMVHSLPHKEDYMTEKLKAALREERELSHRKFGLDCKGSAKPNEAFLADCQKIDTEYTQLNEECEQLEQMVTSKRTAFEEVKCLLKNDSVLNLKLINSIMLSAVSTEGQTNFRESFPSTHIIHVNESTKSKNNIS